jgi:hypothetical protein
MNSRRFWIWRSPSWNVGRRKFFPRSGNSKELGQSPCGLAFFFGWRWSRSPEVPRVYAARNGENRKDFGTFATEVQRFLGLRSKCRKCRTCRTHRRFEVEGGRGAIPWSIFLKNILGTPRTHCPTLSDALELSSPQKSPQRPRVKHVTAPTPLRVRVRGVRGRVFYIVIPKALSNATGPKDPRVRQVRHFGSRDVSPSNHWTSVAKPQFPCRFCRKFAS